VQVNIEGMAKELGVSANRLRINLGVETRLQKEIRAAKTIEEIIAIYSAIIKHNLNSCTPGCEHEELKEYSEKRAELFNEYLAAVTSLDDLSHLSTLFVLSDPTWDECKNINKKVLELITPDVNAAENSSECETILKNLLLVRKGWLENSRHRNLGFDQSHSFSYLFSRARFLLENESKVTISASATVRILVEWKWYWENYNTNGYPFSYLYDRFKTIDDILLLKSVNYSRLFSPDANENFKQIVINEIRSCKSFAEALAKVFRIKEWGNSGNCTYLRANLLENAVCVLAEKISSKKHIVVWERLSKDHVGDENRPPTAYFDAVDRFYLSEVKEAKSHSILLKLLEILPYGSKSLDLTVKILEEEVKKEFALARTKTEISETERIYESMHRVNVFLLARERERGLHMPRVEELYRTANDKQTLIGLFHEFRLDAEIQKEILLRLVHFFPSEQVDEVLVEKE
jgi:hypothetical protein